jgi:hypothetical protein
MRSARVRAIVAAVKIAAIAATTAVLFSSAVIAVDAAQHTQPALTIVTLAAPVKMAAVAPSATIAQLNDLLTTVKADGGTSVLLPDGRVLWLFGDQVNAAGNGFIGRNAAAIQAGSTFQLLPREFRPTTSAGWYWPGAAAVDGGKLVILWAQETATGTGVFDFTQTATIAATYNASTLAQVSQTKSATAKGGSSVVKVGTTWQVYGTRAVVGSYGKDVLRWTVPAGSLGKLGQWSASTKILDDSWGAGTDVAVVQESGHLRLWTKRFDIVGSDIVTADNEGGSWSAPTVLATTGPWTYAVHVHSEQVTRSVTYATNGGDAPQTGRYHLTAIAAQ